MSTTPLAPPAAPAPSVPPIAPPTNPAPADPPSAPADTLNTLRGDLAHLRTELANLTRALATAPAHTQAPPLVGAMSPSPPRAAHTTPLPRSGDRASVLSYLRARRA
ncbi:MAG: hypothetical protein ACT4PL_11185 [Phycisphaerales bacterium]